MHMAALLRLHQHEFLLQVMVANIRCGEILNDQLRALQEDQAWTSLVEAAQQHLLPDFGVQASNLLESCLSGKASMWMSASHTTRC